MEAAIGDGALVHPRGEHRANRAPELLARILREGLAGLLLDAALVLADEMLPVLGRQVGVERETLALLVDLEDLLEIVVVHLEHDVRVHLDEAAIAVIGEALVARALGQRHDGRVVEAEVEDRVHHAGHRGAGAGAHRDEQGVRCIAEDLAGERADLGEALLDLVGEFGRIGPAIRVVPGADLGGDGEAGRDRQAHIGHFGEVGALAAEQVAHARLAFGLAVAEGVDPLCHGRSPDPVTLSPGSRRPPCCGASL